VKLRRRLSLSFAGCYHEFDITDPEFTRRYKMPETAVSHPHQRFDLNAPFFVCLSLTKPFNGKHYKIAATIFEPNA